MSWVPDRKIFSGGAVAVLTWVVLRICQNQGWVDEAATTELPALAGLVAAYLIPPSASDVIKRLDEAFREYGSQKGTEIRQAARSLVSRPGIGLP